MSNFIRLESYPAEGSLWMKEVNGIDKLAVEYKWKAEKIKNIGAPYIVFKNKTAAILTIQKDIFKMFNMKFILVEV